MKFLADENIERPVIEALRAAGHGVASLTEGTRGLTDEQVLRRAKSEARILLTNDKDFGELIFRPGRLATGVVLLRFDTEDGVQKAAQLAELLPGITAQLSGHFAVITEQRVRLRRLPPSTNDAPG